MSQGQAQTLANSLQKLHQQVLFIRNSLNLTLIDKDGQAWLGLLVKQPDANGASPISVKLTNDILAKLAAERAKGLPSYLDLPIYPRSELPNKERQQLAYSLLYKAANLPPAASNTYLELAEQWLQQQQKTPADFSLDKLAFSKLLSQDVLTPKEQAAAELIITHMLGPLANRELPKGLANQFPNRRTAAALGKYLEQQSLLGPARLALLAMLERRQMLTASSAKNASQPSSELQKLRQAATERWHSLPGQKNWYTLMQNSSPEEVAREYAKMRALSAWLQFTLYEQNERIAALLAAKNLQNLRKDS